MTKTLWEILWDYDPNGLVAVDPDLAIRVVNPAFCRMFQVDAAQVIGTPVQATMGDGGDFRRAWEEHIELRGMEQHFPAHDLYVRKVIFPIHEQGLIACILVDMTHEWKQNNEMRLLKRETVLQVHQVVDKQMQIAQQIAELLGETTAETKVSLVNLLKMLEQEER